jgi:hypothetical protein
VLEERGDQGRWVEGLHVEEEGAEKVQGEEDKAVEGMVICCRLGIDDSRSLEAVERACIEWRASHFWKAEMVGAGMLLTGDGRWCCDIMLLNVWFLRKLQAARGTLLFVSAWRLGRLGRLRGLVMLWGDAMWGVCVTKRGTYGHMWSGTVMICGDRYVMLYAMLCGNR